MNKIKQLSVLGLITILFNACGGSGGENSISSGVQNDSTSSFGEYVKYNWSLNTNIDSQFKDDYSIDEYAHINIDPAWTKTKGMTTNSEKIKVAVIDQDFDITHPDIKDKIIATYNAMDDTLNVTNINAYDEPFSHGTATAGVIAANDIGVAPEVELILINVNFDDSQFNNIQSVDSFINAFLKAEELGAKVINCSWGGDFISADLSFELARLKGEGINIVFASGNDEYDLDEIMEEEYTDANDEVQTREVEKYDSEAEDVSVIGVGASTISNDVASYSNYGYNIDVIAPGGSEDLGLLLLDPSGTNGATVDNTGLVNYNYTFGSGTSFAAPHVSGVIALMLAVNPDLTPDRIKQILSNTASKVGDDAEYATVEIDGVIGRFDQKRAFGKINAGAAVQMAEDDL